RIEISRVILECACPVGGVPETVEVVQKRSSTGGRVEGAVQIIKKRLPADPCVPLAGVAVFERVGSDRRVVLAIGVAVQCMAADRGIVVGSVRLQCAPTKGTIAIPCDVTIERLIASSCVLTSGFVAKERCKSRGCVAAT